MPTAVAFFNPVTSTFGGSAAADAVAPTRTTSGSRIRIMAVNPHGGMAMRLSRTFDAMLVEPRVECHECRDNAELPGEPGRVSAGWIHPAVTQPGSPKRTEY